MNKVTLVGRLTRDAVIDEVGNNKTSRARFTIAVARQYKREEADFINCTLFGKVANSLSKYLVKGALVSVAGSIRTDSVEKDGNKSYYVGVNVDTVELLGSKNAESHTESKNEPKPVDDMTPVDDSDMPF